MVCSWNVLVKVIVYNPGCRQTQSSANGLQGFQPEKDVVPQTRTRPASAAKPETNPHSPEKAIIPVSPASSGTTNNDNGQRVLQNPSWFPLEAGNHEGFCK
jgi:hypothetical protein